jgi:hypothetical protein
MQVPAPSFWSAANGSNELWIKIVLGLILGVLAIFGLMAAPVPARRPIVVGVTFLAGLYYVLSWLWPTPIAREKGDLPRNALEGVSFWLADAQNVVTQFSNIISGFLIGLGLFSLLRIHLRRLLRAQKDWGYSLVLLVSMVLMVIFGYWDWIQRQGPNGAILAGSQERWGTAQYGYDLLFDGLMQQMEAGMFSVVAFYILSAAYRAFRARSAEATILLVTALIVVVSLMGIVTYLWDNSFIVARLGDNAKLTSVAGWITAYLQTPAIRGIDFGVGVGLMAMGLRIWLSLEKSGGTA